MMFRRRPDRAMSAQALAKVLGLGVYLCLLLACIGLIYDGPVTQYARNETKFQTDYGPMEQGLEVAVTLCRIPGFATSLSNEVLFTVSRFDTRAARLHGQKVETLSFTPLLGPPQRAPQNESDGSIARRMQVNLLQIGDVVNWTVMRQKIYADGGDTVPNRCLRNKMETTMDNWGEYCHFFAAPGFP